MELQLNLERPIIFFDIESTGLNVTQDRIVELSYIKVFPDGHEQEESLRVNPQMPIPAQATAVHHITDEDVSQCPAFAAVAQRLADTFAGCDLAGFNSNQFDIPLLDEEFGRAGVAFDWTQCHFVDVQTIFHKKEKRDLAAACLFYCGHEMQDHHSSLADTRTTLEVFKAQLERYDDLGKDVRALSAYSSHNRHADLKGYVIYNDKGQEVINFGKHKGKLAEDALREDRGYLAWIMQRDFPSSTKRALQCVQRRIDEQDLEERKKLLLTKNNKLT